MSDEAGAGEPLSDHQKREIAVWFLSNAPAGEIHYAAAAEAFPEYNKAHLVSLELPDRSGDIIISTYGELDKNNYLDPRTAQVTTVDHIKQVVFHNACYVFPAILYRSVTPTVQLMFKHDEELPSAYIEEFRSALDVELSKYVAEAYPKGVDAHYFEEGNVQLDTNIDRKDSTIMQSPGDCAVSITNIIRHHESEYLSSLEESYMKLSDATFKVGRNGQLEMTVNSYILKYVF
nr:unnamed protein product [Digitaria exilis]